MTDKVQRGLQVCGQSSLEGAGLRPVLELELELVCVKKVSVQCTNYESAVRSPPIDRITYDRMSDRVHVNAYLMSPSCERPCKDHGHIAEVLDNLVLGAGRSASRHYCHTFSLSRVPRDRTVYYT